MAEHEGVRQHRDESGVHRRKGPEDLTKEKRGEKDQRPEARDTDGASLESHADLLGDARFSQPANAGQRASILGDLQRSYGNAYVQRLLKSRTVQAKLTVNPPGDKYEQEADRVAEAVTKGSGAEVQRQEEEEEVMPKRAEGRDVQQLQRQEEEEEEVQAKRSGDVAGPELQRQEEEEEEPIQAKADVSRTPEVSEGLEERIKGAQGQGEAVPDSVRGSLEPHFGRDFSNVRVHADAEADEMSRQLGARAFTHGNDIFFREGDYQPQTDEGRQLLAHEMTHTVQQGAAPVAMQAAETEKKAPPEAKEDAENELVKARDKVLSEMSVENVRGLLYYAARCLQVEAEGTAQDALDAVVEQALVGLKKKTGAQEVRTSSMKLSRELIDQLKLGQPMEGEEKEEETAEQMLARLSEWAAPGMHATIKQLQLLPSEAAAQAALERAALVELLGGDASAAIGALKTWREQQSNVG